MSEYEIEIPTLSEVIGELSRKGAAIYTAVKHLRGGTPVVVIGEDDSLKPAVIKHKASGPGEQWFTIQYDSNGKISKVPRSRILPEETIQRIVKNPVVVRLRNDVGDVKLHVLHSEALFFFPCPSLLDVDKKLFKGVIRELQEWGWYYKDGEFEHENLNYATKDDALPCETCLIPVEAFDCRARVSQRIVSDMRYWEAQDTMRNNSLWRVPDYMNDGKGRIRFIELSEWLGGHPFVKEPTMEIVEGILKAIASFQSYSGDELKEDEKQLLRDVVEQLEESEELLQTIEELA